MAPQASRFTSDRSSLTSAARCWGGRGCTGGVLWPPQRRRLSPPDLWSAPAKTQLTKTRCAKRLPRDGQWWPDSLPTEPAVLTHSSHGNGAWALCCSRHKLPENQGSGLTSIPAPLLGEITSDSKENRMQGQKFQGTQNVLGKSAPRGSPSAATEQGGPLGLPEQTLLRLQLLGSPGSGPSTGMLVNHLCCFLGWEWERQGGSYRAAGLFSEPSEDCCLTPVLCGLCGAWGGGRAS